ncbi:FAD-dependent oxidoreductase [Paenibacillus anaericanus]|uniref:FAD-dependent oxidoreductase n=1 Tax=Paenibacillus anaericanus TaxID=170367 RepID=UPI001FEC6FFF|nr:FAD-dependent oxidoreductase [Paenibacillus anaericanus]
MNKDDLLQNLPALPKFPESLWRETSSLPSFPQLNKDIKADVAVVGAGITGITTAYVLTKAGLKVVVLDAATILDGATGYTTAKITSQHGMIYSKLIHHFGEESARLYYEANEEALQFIKNTVQEENIDCHLQQEDAYLYADSDEQAEQLHKEWQAYEQLELPGEWTETLPIPLVTKGAIRLGNQAQFHPLLYLRSLTNYITEHGGILYENTMMEDYAKQGEDGSIALKTMSGHIITCNHAVSASHFPFFDGGSLYFTRLHAERSYAIALEPKNHFSYAGGMYINCEKPKRSLRSAKMNGKEVILIGGESHRTGSNECTLCHYQELEKFGGAMFEATKVPYRWSTQDLITLDDVPYIGALNTRHPNIFVATGYGKWGMTTGTLAALLIRDLILGKENRYTELFSPSRFKMNPSIKNFAVQNTIVAKELVSGKIENVYMKLEDLGTDEGSVVKHCGKRAGAYRDSDGKIFLVDTTCTHLGCELEWNDGERSWDCPCHGSRFNYKGHVLEGPATKDLKPLTVQPEP